ncbi:MAG: DUF11 domain-containing protein [bacterium]|nr:DUF11 domain-containing protein [bacterium]
MNRLTSATIDGSRIEYTYDAAGNITRVLTPYAIRASVSGTGTVADDLGKLDCGDDCEGVYDLNTVVTLTATPDAQAVFDGWSGPCTGTSTCIVTVDEVESLAAAFIPAGADLAVSKTDGLAEAVPGESIEYTITVTNNGPSGVGDALVEDTLTADLTCSWTSLATGSASGSAGSGSGNISETIDLPAGGSMTYTLDCDIDPAATGTLSNTASVSTTVPDPVAGDESKLDETNLAPAADLSLVKDSSAAAVGIGRAITYTLHVTNGGPSTASAVSVVDDLPAGVAFVSASETDWTCGEDGGTVTCDRSSLAPSETSDIEVVVTAPSSPGSLLNSATVSATTAEAALGDESDDATVEVFGPPTIVSVGSVASTEMGEITPGVRTAASLTQLILEVSHELEDPAGDGDSNDVTNPAAYRLYRAQPDGTFTAATCSDSSDVSIGAVTYGVAGPRTIAVPFDQGLDLEAGLYRLLLCSSGPAAIQDVYGNPLDGDGDGTGGDAFEIDFEVRVTNLLANPNFDEDLGEWDVVSQSAGDVVHDAASDASDAPTSGSAHLKNLTGSGSVLEISQCVVVTAGESYLLGGQVKTNGLGPTFPEVRALVETFDGADCTGSSLGVQDASGVAGKSSGFWVDGWNQLVTAPAPAASARLTLRVSGDELDAAAWLDDTQLYFYGLVVFVDGFETGDLSEWDG